MALLFAANGDVVTFPANSALDLGATGTFLMWLRLNDDTQRTTIFDRTNSTTAYYSLGWRGDLAGDEFQFNRETSGTDIGANANAANFAAYGLNKWLFIACVYDKGGANSAQKMLMGDLATVAAEPSAYTSQTTGTGTCSTTFSTAVLNIGNHNSTTTREHRGDIAWFGIWNTALSNQQIIEQQFHPHVTAGCVFFGQLGFPGTTSRDYSGLALTGTVTGATASAHVPMRPWYGAAPGWRGNVAAAAGGSATLTADVGSYTLTGTAAALLQGYKLTADAGSYALTGNTVGLNKGRSMTASAGTYTLTGLDASFGRTVTGTVGVYALTGNAAALKWARLMPATNGSYALSGTSASLLQGYKLTADAGTYTLTGNDITLTGPGTDTTMQAEAGAYSLTGTAAALKWAHTMPATSGSYALTGSAANLLQGYKMAADAGSYTLTGNAAAFPRTYILASASGSYVLTGLAAALSKTGSYSLVAEAGSYALTGNVVSLLRGYAVAAESGVYALTGSAAAFGRLYVMAADPGTYTLNGNAVSFSFLGLNDIVTPPTSFHILPMTTGFDVILVKSSIDVLGG